MYGVLEHQWRHLEYGNTPWLQLGFLMNGMGEPFSAAAPEESADNSCSVSTVSEEELENLVMRRLVHTWRDATSHESDPP